MGMGPSETFFLANAMAPLLSTKGGNVKAMAVFKTYKYMTDRDSEIGTC